MKREPNDPTPAELAGKPIKMSNCWPGGWQEGDEVEATATPHAGENGQVVKWKDEWGIPRPGLVPVFLPKYSHTFFWWFPPHALKRSNFES